MYMLSAILGYDNYNGIIQLFLQELGFEASDVV